MGISMNTKLLGFFLYNDSRYKMALSNCILLHLSIRIFLGFWNFNVNNVVDNNLSSIYENVEDSEQF